MVTLYEYNSVPQPECKAPKVEGHCIHRYQIYAVGSIKAI